MFRMRSWPIALCLTVGCQSGPAASSVPVPRTVARVTLQIGQVDGEGPDVFGRIGGLLADADGRIIVADYQASEVRVFTADGEHSFSFGREGSGPGEMAEPCCMAFSPDGHLWLRDGGNHRYSGYRLRDTTAEFVEQREMAHADANYWAQLSFGSDGTLIDVGHRVAVDGEFQLARLFLTPDGREVPPEVAPTPAPSEIGLHSMKRETEGGQFWSFVSQPFGPRQVVAHGPNGVWAHGISSDYAISLITSSSTIEVARPGAGPTLSQREREAAAQAFERQLQGTGSRISDLPFGIPVHKPAVRSLFFDSTGHLWVERSVPDGESRVADVWSLNGELVGEVEWPADVSLGLPGWVGHNSALGIRTDALGVQYVVRIEFEDFSTK